MKQWYESLFENYAQKYDKEPYVQGTPGECDFIEQEINRDKSIKILDIGCGTGRHAIELAKRGYDLTGVDLSRDQIQRPPDFGLLKGKKVMVFNTTGGPRFAYYLSGYKSATKNSIDARIFKFCGMKVILHKFFYAVPAITDAVRKKMLASIGSIIF